MILTKETSLFQKDAIQDALDAKQATQNLVYAGTDLTYAQILANTRLNSYSWAIESNNNIKLNDIARIAIEPLDARVSGIKIYINGIINAIGEDSVTLISQGLESTIIDGGNIITGNLSAISADMGTLSAGVIKHDTVGSTNGIWISADTNTSSNITVGNSGAINTWRLLVNNKFGVTKDGILYANGGSFNGRIEATEGYIANSVTIGSGGTALSTIEANAKQSQIYNIGVNNGTTGYHFLGTLTLSGQTAEAEIEIHTGAGQNNSAYQNLTVRVNIKRGYQATTAATAGITVRYEGDPTIVTIGESNCSIIARCTEVGVLNIYMYTPNWGYADGWYQVKGRNWSWIHSGTLVTTEPSEGTAQTISTMNAYTTATNYITQIDSAGIFISPSSQSPTTNSPGNSIKINGTGLYVYENNSVLSEYTGDGVRLFGKIDGNTRGEIARLYSGNAAYDGGQKALPYFALGNRTDSTPGGFSITLGKDNQATGYTGMAFGLNCKANAHWTTAIGDSCQASGTRSIAIGHNCKSTNNWTTTIGANLISGESNQTVIGKGNESKGGAFIIGGGSTEPSSTNRFNLLELDWSGNLAVKGTVKATRYDLKNSQEYVGYVLGYSNANPITFSNNTWTVVDERSVGEGDWIIGYSLDFIGNSNGARGVQLRQIDSGGNNIIGHSMRMVRATAYPDATRIGGVALIHIKEGGGTIKLEGFQNSSSSLTGSFYLNIMRIAE